MKQLFYDKKKSIVVAEHWDELSCSQFIGISKLLHSGMSDLEYAMDKALYILSGKWLLNFLMIPADLRLRMHEHIKWILEEKVTTKQFIKKYKGLYGPEDNFENLVMAEFHHTEIAYYKIVHEEDAIAGLNELVAILFREAKPKPYNHKRNADGDHRIDFLFTDIQYHQRKVERWPVAVKQAIMIWYDACRQELVKLYPTAFAGSGGTSENYSVGLFGMMRNLSGGRFGSFEKVEKMPVHLAFSDVVESIQEANEWETKMKAK